MKVLVVHFDQWPYLVTVGLVKKECMLSTLYLKCLKPEVLQIWDLILSWILEFLHVLNEIIGTELESKHDID